MGIHDQDTVPLSHTGGTLGLAMREINAPRQLGSVRLIREIGKGGMGVVWLGHDDMLGRDVAVKFLLGAAATDDDPNFGVFLEGARAAAKLKCAGMTAVFHADVVDHAPYIVMEYVDGPTLSRVVHKAGPLVLPAAIAVMQSVCATVAELHEAGIIHRDIKPSNIMLDTDCRVYLTDFGIAITRPVGESSAENVGLAGTPSYMAPEAFDGTAGTRTDTYSLGMTFYELLTGDPAFEGEFSKVRTLHRSHDLPLTALRERQVDQAAIEIIERATHKDPKYRYKNARHMLEAIERAPLPKSVRQRADTELRSAALKCRAGGDGLGSKDGSSAELSGRSLYDHLSTLAAKKRSDIPTPMPAPKPPSVGDLDGPAAVGGDPPAMHATIRSVTDFVCGKCSARFSSADAVGSCPSCGSAVLRSDPLGGHHIEREEKDEGPVKASTIAWIGLALFFFVLLVVIALIMSPWK